jgi:5-methylcytosine-specific restriction protein B
MTQADRIRQAALDVYIAPAHEGGATEVIIRAGDLHQLLGLKNAMPAVCSAVRSSKFEKLACVILVD